jgi:hypothetical protein
MIENDDLLILKKILIFVVISLCKEFKRNSETERERVVGKV